MIFWFPQYKVRKLACISCSTISFVIIFPDTVNKNPPRVCGGLPGTLVSITQGFWVSPGPAGVCLSGPSLLPTSCSRCPRSGCSPLCPACPGGQGLLLSGTLRNRLEDDAFKFYNHPLTSSPPGSIPPSIFSSAGALTLCSGNEALCFHRNLQDCSVYSFLINIF